MKILTLYVLETFAKILAFVLPVVVSLYLVVEFVERIDEFLQHEASLGTILLYFLLRTPIVSIQVGPLAVLMSVALSLALLQRSREIIALLASGINPWHIIYPLLLGAMLTAGLSLGAEEIILPGAHRALMALQQDRQHGPPQGVLIQQGEIWFRAPPGAFVHIELLDPSAEHIHGLTIYRKNTAGELVEQIYAREAVWSAGEWLLLDGTTSRLQGQLTTHVENFSRLEMALGMEPSSLRSLFTPPSHMSLSDLRSYIKRLRNRGVDMTLYARDFQTKLANPFMGLVMAIIGLAAMWGTHETRKISVGFVGMLCGAGIYWLMMLAGTALSISQQLPLLVGIWLPHLFVLSLSSVIVWRRAWL